MLLHSRAAAFPCVRIDQRRLCAFSREWRLTGLYKHLLGEPATTTGATLKPA